MVKKKLNINSINFFKDEDFDLKKIPNLLKRYKIE